MGGGCQRQQAPHQCSHDQNGQAFGKPKMFYQPADLATMSAQKEALRVFGLRPVWAAWQGRKGLQSLCQHA
eukprot:scaffold221081_cov13-Tisochrysis_lutea.AAC.1